MGRSLRPTEAGPWMGDHQLHTETSLYLEKHASKSADFHLYVTDGQKPNI